MKDHIEQTAKIAHSIAREKGFWDLERNIDEMRMLIIGECSEALEAHRNGYKSDLATFNMNMGSGTDFAIAFKSSVKDGFEDELADVVIRIMDLMCGLDWSFDNDFSIDPSSITTENVGEILLSVTKLICNGERLDMIKAMYIIFSMASKFDIDLNLHIDLKMEYNSTRQKLHGKKY